MSPTAPSDPAGAAMRIPEAPTALEQTDLMRRLRDYADGRASWEVSNLSPDPVPRRACATLYERLSSLIEHALAPILDRATAREFETFTMHDRSHAQKVAHLMWHLIEPERRLRLTPPEIALLVTAAYLHDAGMALSPAERDQRFAPESDLWDKVEADDSLRLRIESLRRAAIQPQLPSDVVDPEERTLLEESLRKRAERQLFQAQEALLSQYTRANHATPSRYNELLDSLEQFHQADPARVPAVRAGLAFKGDSFRQELVDICVSHNEDAMALVSRDLRFPERPRFPRALVVGGCSVDLLLIAGALRLADILDFDRERTPPVLFYYLLPTSLSPADDASVLEWSKHLSISAWQIGAQSVLYQGRCTNHIVHHAIVLFAQAIEREIRATRASFAAFGEGEWPFVLPDRVELDIQEEGYRYVPYRFELDDSRVHQLLMGGAIYDEPFAAVRELIQNSVDACKLRETLTSLYEDGVTPALKDPVVVRYQEPTAEFPSPRLTVEDKGAGMDQYIIEQYFLQVGRSYYSSADFSEIRAALRRVGLDFAPVADFGIGFLSVFLLADRVSVETAMWESVRGDTRKRTLLIDGPTRLIRLHDEPNTGLGRFKGTRVTLELARRGGAGSTPTWDDLVAYIERTCQDLPYLITLEHVTPAGVALRSIHPQGTDIGVSDDLRPSTIFIRVDEPELCFEGNIAITNPVAAREIDRKRAIEAAAEVRDPRFASDQSSHDSLLRGGFRLGPVPGLPKSYIAPTMARARLRLRWESNPSRRYRSTNIARTAVGSHFLLAEDVRQVWLSHLIERVEEIPEEFDLSSVSVGHNLRTAHWLRRFNALQIYQLARRGWIQVLDRKKQRGKEALTAWESGEGPALWLGMFDEELPHSFLNIIGHKITTRVFSATGQWYLNPPVSRDWQVVLERCSDFLPIPQSWDDFALFTKPIRHRLLHAYAGQAVFNEQYRDMLGLFGNQDISRLRNALGKLALARERDRRAYLDSHDVNLSRVAIASMGELMIGTEVHEWRLDSFQLPKE